MKVQHAWQAVTHEQRQARMEAACRAYYDADRRACELEAQATKARARAEELRIRALEITGQA